MPLILKNKVKHLTELIEQSGRLAVAFSAGVDSTFLLKIAQKLLPPDKILALTAIGSFFPQWESSQAADLATIWKIPHLVVEFDALANSEVAANPPDRCYYCKLALFKKLIAEARKRGFKVMVDGGNWDDRTDFRPGTKAKKELGVRSPLAEAALSKAEIRQLSEEMGLPTWNKPSSACLASRFPYGQAITNNRLAQVEQAEDFLMALGFQEIRVRYHGLVARLEVGPDERAKMFDLNLMDKINHKLKTLGFTFVALDLGGYRTGNLNQAIDPICLNKYAQND